VAKPDAGNLGDRLSQVVQESTGPLRRPTAGVVPFRPGGREDTEETSAHESLPNRYQLRDRADGPVLLSSEAPGVTVSLDRCHAFSEAESRKLGERVILLDGAGQFGPLVDDVAHLYNLDHHEGCLRAFTLATCEQALILVLKGLKLDKGDWTLYANEPDLDTVFAIWVLLNYRRVRSLTPRQRDAILPLLRLEGAIDANGFEVGEQCGLTQAQVQREKERLDLLHSYELEIKGRGEWGKIDLIEYTRDMLLRIDHYVFTSADFRDYSSVEEVYGHVELGVDHVAVVCRDSSGIYEVERRLKKVWGDRLGIIALERESGQFTLRRTAGLAGIDLEDAYSKFNLLDPVVDGRPPEKRWGGSDDIGGSPRPQGTGLTPLEISNILKLTFKAVSPWQHVQRFATASLWIVGLVLAGAAAVFAWQVFAQPADTPEQAALGLALAAGVLGLGAAMLTQKLSSGWTWLFGWRRPAGRDWLALTPVIWLGAAVGGAWIPPQISTEPPALFLGIGALLLAALALEVCFRGLLHGLLVFDDRVQVVNGRWFISRPAWVSGLLYAIATSIFSWRGWIAGTPLTEGLLQGLGICTVGALIVGLALSVVRERSLSIWPAVVLLGTGGLVRFLVEIWRMA